MSSDPITALIELGYTQREAGFLYRAARCSGFFLRRQYSQFVHRDRGAIQHQFLHKALGKGHIQALNCSRSHHLYHIKSRLIYGLLGIENSQNRRLKGDEDIKLRLMSLDYVLGHSDRRFLITADEKVHAFDELKIPKLNLPSSVFPNPGNRAALAVRYFADRFPIAAPGTPDHGQLFEFTYFDHGTSTIKPFLRHLNGYKPLFLALGRFQLIYVSDSQRNFAAASATFDRTFAIADDGSNRKLLPFGAEHLIHFFEAQQLWDANSPRLTTEHVKILREGEKAYRKSEHGQLRQAWESGLSEFDRKLSELGVKKKIAASFATCLLPHDYPLSVANYAGKPQKRAVYAAV
jgi:hypothetical protein